MKPILFQLGPINIYSFGALIALGAILGGMFAYWAAKKRRISIRHWFDTILYTFIAGIIGGRITYYFLYPEEFNGFWQLITIWQGGLLLLGALCLGFLCFLYQTKRLKEPVWQVLDIGALSLLIGWAIGKFGCHLSACSVGRSSQTFLSIDGAFPVDLFSSVWALIIFMIMVFAWLKNKLSDGVVFFLSIEALLLGDLLIKTLRLDFGTGLTRIEALIYLALIVLTYILFWKLHGPRVEKESFGTRIRNFVFRKHLR